MGGPPAAVATVRRAVRRHLEEFPSGALILVACSGGADSLALAAATAFVAPRLGLRAGAMTVDHGLQEGSAQRAAALLPTLRRLGLDPVDLHTVRVGRAGGPEGAARRARYAALDSGAEAHGAESVLLGHTRDDQAETVLLRLARGSGARSLAGMSPCSGRYRRPLLDVDRSTVRNACAQMGLTAWEDPHNRDPAYARSRVRSQALPILEETLGPGVAAALARSADLLRDDAAALDDAAAQALDRCRHPGGGADLAVLAELPRAVRTRVLRQLAVAAGVPEGALGAVHIHALDRLVTHYRGQSHVDLPGRVCGRRRHGCLFVEHTDRSE
ncbi:tRNA lysidine(34) synthetase TilS [Lipingzhangella sp. LS1_29]|uniref:tRNA(Ile)-lysidine synthase n=1 Tax=Lipingzhangella rawalii TaxID=2055835 RepID=A0ABU2H5Z6_9ACTN|nr:tRNA lysidine(34) synthetase TilS [Lipingzhangella rawalii]MDS1270260.1 tRNA lysidine(34) synthetase TilS [Lipingzhangella rawalii]